MKYLKTYKIFENQNYKGVAEYLDTILTPLVDINFDYKIEVYNTKFSDSEFLIRQGHEKFINSISDKTDFKSISIEIVKKGEWWKKDLDTVTEVILSSALYLKTLGFLPKATAINFSNLIKTEYIDKLNELEELFKNSGTGVGVSDVFGNNIHKTSGVDDQYEYEIRFTK